MKTLPNFRDLGGLRGAAGVLRPGLLYRTAQLSSLDEEAARAVAGGLAVRTYIDLRTDDEIARDGAPDRLVEAGVAWQRLPMSFVDGAFAAVTQPGPADWTALYLRALERHRDGLRRLVELAAAAPGAIAFGCSAGKDRTGVAAALLLSAVEIDEAEIARDYSRTTGDLAPHLELFAWLWRDNQDLRARIVASYFQAHAESIAALLATARGRAGGLAAALGIDEGLRAALRERYLTASIS